MCVINQVIHEVTSSSYAYVAARCPSRLQHSVFDHVKVQRLKAHVQDSDGCGHVGFPFHPQAPWPCAPGEICAKRLRYDLYVFDSDAVLIKANGKAVGCAHPLFHFSDGAFGVIRLQDLHGEACDDSDVGRAGAKQVTKCSIQEGAQLVSINKAPWVNPFNGSAIPGYIFPYEVRRWANSDEARLVSFLPTKPLPDQALFQTAKPDN
jgi:hypothetical protein